MITNNEQNNISNKQRKRQWYKKKCNNKGKQNVSQNPLSNKGNISSHQNISPEQDTISGHDIPYKRPVLSNRVYLPEQNTDSK